MKAPDKIKQKLGKLVEIAEHNPKRYYIKVAPANLREVVRYIFKDLGARLCTASAVDTRAGFEVNYHFAFDLESLICTLKVVAPRENPTVDSIHEIVPGAEWIEFEMNELMGVSFKGNPRTKPLLLADDWPEGVYPLRKKEYEKGSI